VPRSFLTLDQLAGILEIAPPAPPAVPDPVGDVTQVLRAWLRALDEAPWEAMLERGPSAHGNVRYLTVWVFLSCELLVDAYGTCRVDAADKTHFVEAAERIGSKAELLSYAEERERRWSTFCPLPGRDPLVDGPHGASRFSALLEHRRRHVAYQYRAVVEILRAHGAELGEPLDLAALPDLRLPGSTF
jgi:hypothetical protein